MEERWKTIKGFDMYEVSDHGRVRNIYTGRIRKLTKTKRKDIAVTLSKNGINYTKKRRILVVETNKIYDSIGMCGEYIGLSREVITRCLRNGETNKLDYHFEVVDD